MSPNPTLDPFCLSNLETYSLEIHPNPIKILIVDDNPENLRLLSKILTQCGYTVQRAISGQLALNAVRANPPHLILLDLLMPDLNGYEVCRQLKSEDKTCEIPVIFLSALTEELNKVKAFEVGGVDYIIKPFQPKEVLMRVKHQLTILGLQHQLQKKNQDLTDRNIRLQQEIQERQQAEEALKKSQFQLEKTIHHLKMTQSQLIQTEKMSSLGQMVAGIAHEINNPINFIYGNLNHAESYILDLLYIIQTYKDEYPHKTPKLIEILEEIDFDFLKDDIPRLLASMKVGSDRIRQIVLSLRTFSRLDESCMKSVDLHEGIESTLLIVWHQFKEENNKTNITLKQEYEKIPNITCNAGHINQVILHILSNAIDALDDYRHLTSIADRIPTISIRTEHTNNDTVKLEISDNGSGIPESVRQQIFDPFFTTKPVGSGSGLGLSISYSIIVTEHGGQLHCHSIPGVGTTFTIELPIQGKSVITNQ
jgi:two-component system, NtrC family, sensor kinase